MTSRERCRFAAALCLGALLSLVCEADAEPQGTTDPAAMLAARNKQDRVVKAILDRWHVDATVVRKACGERNSWYDPSDHTILLCDEMLEFPDAAVFFAAHEASHAVTHQITSSIGEEDADEIAALEMIRLGMLDELLGAAIYWKQQDVQGHIKGDPHPGHGYRAWNLACMEDGSEDRPAAPICRLLYQGTLLRWTTRLNAPREDGYEVLIFQL